MLSFMPRRNKNKSSNNKTTNTPTKKWKPKSDWNTLLTEGDQYKLSNQELVEKKQKLLSKNNILTTPPTYKFKKKVIAAREQGHHDNDELEIAQNRHDFKNDSIYFNQSTNNNDDDFDEDNQNNSDYENDNQSNDADSRNDNGINTPRNSSSKSKSMNTPQPPFRNHIGKNTAEIHSPYNTPKTVKEKYNISMTSSLKIKDARQRNDSSAVVRELFSPSSPNKNVEAKKKKDAPVSACM